jgi:solute carrier family 26 (sodium-independent sulfate anion transporter), member 11
LSTLTDAQSITAILLLHDYYYLFVNSAGFTGFLIDFISGPVSAGFTSAAAIVIATSQLKDLLGINIKANSFIGFWDQLAMHIREISVGDGTLGITCMIVLLLLRVSPS